LKKEINVENINNEINYLLQEIISKGDKELGVKAILNFYGI